MADVTAKLIKGIPRTGLIICGERWRFYTDCDMKRRNASFFAKCDTDGRTIEICADRRGNIERVALDGFRVHSGTPLRGLVTELRRMGYMEVTPFRRVA